MLQFKEKAQRKEKTLKKERKISHQSPSGQVFTRIIASDYSQANLLAGLQEAETVIQQLANQTKWVLAKICSLTNQYFGRHLRKGSDLRKTTLANAATDCVFARI